MIPIEVHRQLLALARQALEARVRRQRRPSPISGGALDLRRGAFVSVHCGRALRGCLGRLEPDWPLHRVVVHLAEAVADSDPRFEPVAAEELPDLEIEISILTPEREVTHVDEIVVGRHGLIVEQGGRRGLLLPQVAVEHQWSRETFLDHTCLKAGLPPTAWRHGVRMFVFEAQVLGEHG
jgi:AmmeMemoRadiSam system protein A